MYPVLNGGRDDIGGNRTCLQTRHIRQGKTVVKFKIFFGFGKRLIVRCQWSIKGDDQGDGIQCADARDFGFSDGIASCAMLIK